VQETLIRRVHLLVAEIRGYMGNQVQPVYHMQGWQPGTDIDDGPPEETFCGTLHWGHGFMIGPVVGSMGDEYQIRIISELSIPRVMESPRQRSFPLVSIQFANRR